MNNELSPAEAIKLLFQSLSRPNIRFVKKYVAEDLANLRRARPDNNAFVLALYAVSRDVTRAALNPKTHGVPLERDLHGWRKSKFAGKNGQNPDLRILFRGTQEGLFELLAFGDRFFPDSVYFTAKQRNSK